jgi:hypothetical protein
MDGWGKPKTISAYINSCERSVRTLMKDGLPYSKLPSGTVLIKFSDVDKFLEKYKVQQDQVDTIVTDVLKELGG